VIAFHERDDQRHDLYWLADGWHRVLAAEEAGLTTFDVDVHAGGVQDAILYAAGANAKHGLKRTNRDKHRAVRMVLDHPTVIREEWGNARVAHAAGVSEFLVKTVRHEREIELGLPPSTERRGADGKLYSLQLRAPKERQGSSTAPSDVEPRIEPGAASINGSGLTPTQADAFLYQCETDGCDAVTTEPSWHCQDCGAHLPIAEYPASTRCPVCADSLETPTLPVLATVHREPLPVPERNGTTQAPYTPGMMKPSGMTLAYERLAAAVNLLDSLAEYDPAGVMRESPDRERFMARLRGARTTLHALIEACEMAEV
jgi:hypothetical protein